MGRSRRPSRRRRQAKQLLADQMPFHVADPTGPLVAELNAADQVVYRPEVLRHFAAGGEYGMLDLRGGASQRHEADADPQRRRRPHDAGGVSRVS